MKLKISEIRPNPFKKYIRNGEYDKDRLDILKESIEHSTLPEHFFARKYEDIYQLTSGHHRLEALKQVKGRDYQVDVTIVTFSDEQMLVDMVRENITQRDTDFHDTRESISLARSWLQSKAPTVKQFNNRLKDGTLKGSEPLPDSYRSIADFLSKNGKAVSYVTVKNYLDITDKLSHRLLDKVKKQDHATGEKDDDSIGVKEAIRLAQFDDKKEQEDLAEALTSSREQHGNLQGKNISAYKDAPDEIKQKVRKGEIDIADVQDEVDRKELTSKAENRPTTVFVPNFNQRMRDFNNNVNKLEGQVKLFSKVFHSSDFKERYYTLKPNQKQVLNQTIFDIKKRIKDCYEEIDFFMEQLSDRNILLVDGRDK